MLSRRPQRDKAPRGSLAAGWTRTSFRSLGGAEARGGVTLSRCSRASRFALSPGYGPKNSRTRSNQFLARGLCAPGFSALIASSSRNSSFCRGVSFTGVSMETWQ